MPRRAGYRIATQLRPGGGRRRLKPGAVVPTSGTMSVGSGLHTAGPLVEAPGGTGAEPDRQVLLLAELVGFMTKDTPSVQHVLDLMTPHLCEVAGLTAATVFELDSESGLMAATAQFGEPGRRDQMVAGKVFRAAAGGPPVVSGQQMAIRLRIGGQTVGVLLLTGERLAELRPDTISTIALHFATTLQGLFAEKARQFVAHTSTTIQELFEKGMTAGSVEEAAELLTHSCATAFRTEHAGLHLIDSDGRIRYVYGVGCPDERLEQLRLNLVGKSAIESPVWRSTVESGEPVLINNASTAKVRPGGMTETLGLGSFIAMPLMTGFGAVGMVLCGDSSGAREWSGRDRILAQQLSAEGALIMDSARMRQANRLHVEELTRQAFHDSLTGLPNRKHLLDRGDEAIEIAMCTGTRLALLLLDLNGFKQVNDTIGHHAGDVLLQLVAKRLDGLIRKPDLVARLGGDEFSVLVTGNPDDQAAVRVGERICERLREPFEIDGKPVQIGASIGVALFPRHATNIGDLMKDADASMYLAKRSGGGVHLTA
ncbi:membrane protein [Actinoplanes sp. SE50]|nr:putative membrane protein in llm 5'region [Actinoplanes sp. SE50/110]ATO84633.1 membrane protein [Actinoplanes sp. SE50]SLM02043.1 membrane protein [Actinoplanes sp. SE50/110]